MERLFIPDLEETRQIRCSLQGHIAGEQNLDPITDVISEYSIEYSEYFECGVLFNGAKCLLVPPGTIQPQTVKWHL